MPRTGVLTEWDAQMNGPIGNKVRNSWDFPESDQHYEMVTATEDAKRRSFRVHKSGTRAQRIAAANVLAIYQGTMDRVIQNMKQKKNLTDLQRAQRKLFLEMHDKHGHKVQEMNLTYTRFSGMNKPYKIVLNQDAPEIGPRIRGAQDLRGTAIKNDLTSHIGMVIPHLRPTSRIIFLNARSGYSEELIVHELAHTVANHVVFRPDDHGSDFRAAEKFVASCL